MRGRGVERQQPYGQRRVRDAQRKIKTAEAIAWTPRVSQVAERNLMGKSTIYSKIQLPE